MRNEPSNKAPVSGISVPDRSSYEEADQKRMKAFIVNLTENARDELMQDGIAAIASFSAQLYRQRRAKRKIEGLIAELQQNGED